MDKSETFIKMSEKAEEIQEKAPKHLTDDGRFLFTHCGENLYVRRGASFNDEGFSKGGKLVWLPRQDQLQEMIGEDIYTNIKNAMWSILDNFHRYAFSSNAFNEFIPLTMEQLWLAFVMKEKYNKAWDGENWEGV